MKKNRFVFGILLAMVFPVVAHVLTELTTWNLAIGNKELSLYVIAALANLLLVRYYYRNQLENTARGIILITFAAAIVLIFTKNISV